MAFVVNRSVVTKVMAKREITEATGLAVGGVYQTLTGGTDDLLAFTNPNPLVANIELYDALSNAYTGTFSKQRSVATSKRTVVNLEFLMMGHGSATAVWTTNGYRAIDALLCSCGLYRTATPGAANTVTYAPASIAQLNAFELGGTDLRGSTVAINPGGVTSIGSCSIAADCDSYTWKAHGVWGNMVFEGGPSTGLISRYSGIGIYNEPVATSTLFSGFTGGSNRQKPFLGATATMSIKDTSDVATATSYAFVGHNLRFDVGTQVTPLMDFNATTGLKGFLVSDRRPSLTMTISMEGYSGSHTPEATPVELYTAWTSQYLVNTSFKLGTAENGNVITFSIPKGRITNIQPGVDSGHRTHEITILPTGAAYDGTMSAESEFLISVGNS